MVILYPDQLTVVQWKRFFWFNVQMVFLCEIIYPGLHSTIIFFFSDVQMSCVSFSGSLAIFQIRWFFIESTCENSKNCMVFFKLKSHNYSYYVKFSRTVWQWDVIPIHSPNASRSSKWCLIHYPGSDALKTLGFSALTRTATGAC